MVDLRAANLPFKIVERVKTSQEVFKSYTIIAWSYTVVSCASLGWYGVGGGGSVRCRRSGLALVTLTVNVIEN